MMKRSNLLVIALLTTFLLVCSVSATYNWTWVGDRYESNNGTFKFVMWNSSGSYNWIIPAGITNVEYMIVAGGGAGGLTPSGYGGGGGGAGGMVEGNTPVNGTNISLKVGGGAPARPTDAPYYGYGEDSYFGQLLNASGGGRGGDGTYSNAAGSGGSGGGSRAGAAVGLGNVGGYSPPEGYNGGGSITSGGVVGQGGGGGAGFAGSAGNTTRGGDGGGGRIPYIMNGLGYLAGGGGGSSSSSTVNSSGGAGGGGIGGNIGYNGQPGTGSGGGGGRVTAVGMGGGGIIIIRYTANPDTLIADFEGTRQPSTIDELVNFSDTSSGTPTAWNWSFGDGNYSSSQNPSYGYVANGIYSVTLNVTNATGSYREITHTHTVQPDPIETIYDYGTASASYSYSTNAPARAFNNNFGDYWQTTPGNWLQMDYNATTTHVINQIKVYSSYNPVWYYHYPREFYVLGGNDTTNWDTLLIVNASNFPTEHANSSLNLWHAYNFTNNVSYRYYRYVPQFCDSGGGGGYSANGCLGIEIDLVNVSDPYRNEPNWYIDPSINRQFTLWDVLNNTQSVSVFNDTYQQFYDDTVTQDYPVTNWFWDFESDGVIDNTTQNPLYKYTQYGNYTVSLTTTVNGVNRTAPKRVNVVKRFDSYTYLYSTQTTFSATSTYSSNPPTSALDKSLSTYWQIDQVYDGNMYFEIDYTYPRVANTLMMNGGDIWRHYLPQSYNITASNDHTNWVTVFDKYDNRSQMISQMQDTAITYYYNFSNTNAYRYYRINGFLSYETVRSRNTRGFLIAEIDFPYSDPRLLTPDFKIENMVPTWGDLYSYDVNKHYTLMNGTTYNFNDTSLSYYGITTWAWDMTNDGSVESSVKNFSYAPPAAGDYTMKLTVSDGVNPYESMLLNYTVIDNGLEPLYGNTYLAGASASTTSYGSPQEAFDRYEDDDRDNIWITESYPDQWLGIDYGQSYGVDRQYVINGYAIRSAGNYPWSNPHIYSIAASNDTVNWDIVENDIIPYNRARPGIYEQNGSRWFIGSFVNTVPYRYYRLLVNNSRAENKYGESTFAISELKFVYNNPKTWLQADAYIDGEGYLGTDTFQFRAYNSNQSYSVLRNKSVTFHDISVGNPNSFQWDLDSDGDYDVITKNFTYTFTNPGIYNITYVVGDGARIDTKYIKVNVQNSIEYWYYYADPNGSFTSAASSTSYGSSIFPWDGTNSEDRDNIWLEQTTYPYAWIQYLYGNEEAHVVNEISIRQSSSYPDQFPRKFWVVASNDSITWTTLDERLVTENRVLKRKSTADPWLTWNMTNTGAYKYHRIYMSLSTPSANSFYYAISEIQLKYHDPTNWLEASWYIEDNNKYNGIITLENIYMQLHPSYDLDSVTTLAGSVTQFRDNSMGSPTGWTWDFGDGTSSNLQHPTKIFDQAGEYNVTLTITKPGSVQTAKMMRVYVQESVEFAYMLYIANSSGSGWDFAADATNFGSLHYLFDHNNATAQASIWVDYIAQDSGKPAWFWLDFANLNNTEMLVINEVWIRSSDRWYDYPRAWIVEGSNDSSNWDLLCNRTNRYDTFAEPTPNAITKIYGFNNTVGYRYYKFTTLSTGNDLAISEFQFRYHDPDRYLESDFDVNRSFIAYDDVANNTISRTVFVGEQVKFTDRSVYNGSVNYTWNFDGDNAIDYNTSYVYYTFPTEGDYLVVHNISKGLKNSSKMMYIHAKADAIEPAYGQYVATPYNYRSAASVAATPAAGYEFYRISDHSISSILGWAANPPKWSLNDYGGDLSNMSATDEWKYPAINQYVVKSYTSSSTYVPTSWEVTASNDLITWNVMDAQYNVSNWSASVNEERMYNFTNVQPYRYWNFTALTKESTSAIVRIPEVNYFITPSFISTTPPIAEFTATQVNISTYAQDIQFADNSINGGTPASWNWSFGDGTYSNEKNPKHWYSVEGTYIVNMTATNSGGSDTSNDLTIRVLNDFDTQVKFWLQFNHSTTVDRAGNSWTASGNAKVDSTGVKSGFGNASMYLDGIGDYLSTSASSTAISLGGNNVTIEMWIKRGDTVGDNQVLLSKSNLSSDNGYALYLAGNRLNFRADHTGIDQMNQLRMISSSEINDTNWHHVAVQRGGNTWRLYIDGIVNDTESWAYTVSSNSYAVRLGKTDYTSPYYYKGYIDEFRLSTKVRWDNNTFMPPHHEYMSSEQLVVTYLPVPVFTTNSTGGVSPAAIQFYDASSNGPTEWFWSFGDGNVSYDQNPVHVYEPAGSYFPSLVVSNDGGNSTSSYSQPTPLVILAPVTANFSASPRSGSSPVTVYFTDTSSGGPTSWYWEFGDGSLASTVKNPVHIYSANGSYNVSLTAGNIAGANQTVKYDYIQVLSIPEASFSSNQSTGYFPMAVQFNDTSSGNPTYWNWSFGDGNFSNEQNPVYLFTYDSTFAVSLYCSNANGNSTASTTVFITPSELSIKTIPVVVNTSTNCVYFLGENTGSATTVWFEYGMVQSYTSGYKSFKTKNQTNVAGNFTYKQCGIPILPGESYVVQAGGDVGGVLVYGANRTFTMAEPVPHPTTTYEQQVDTFVEDGLDPIALLTYDIWQPYLGLMGGLFFGILIAFIFMNIAIKQRTIAMTIILLFLTGTVIWAIMPAAFVQIAQMLFIAGIAGILYWLFMKRR